MDNMWAHYIQEREGALVEQSSHGFAVYKVHGDIVYIQDIYVTPEYRQTGEASRLADKVAEKAKIMGCSNMLGSVDISARGATASLKVLLSYGMELDSLKPPLIYFKKVI